MALACAWLTDVDATTTEPVAIVQEAEETTESEWLTFEATDEQETWRTFTATAYTANCRGCTGITKTGIDVRQTIVDEEGRRIIAVDPRVIPLGSRIDIRIGSEIIEGVAEDIGGAIKGARIDVLMADYSEAVTFGRQDVEVRIINEKEAEE